MTRFNNVAAVKLMRIAVVMALLALWVPASSHALLEHAGWIHQHDEEVEHSHDDDGDHHPPADTKDHDAADGICRVESSAVDVPSPTSGDAWLLGDWALWSVLVSDEPDFSGPSPPGTAPPELFSSWQFSYRAAVPVRAPSFAS